MGCFDNIRRMTDNSENICVLVGLELEKYLMGCRKRFGFSIFIQFKYFEGGSAKLLTKNLKLPCIRHKKECRPCLP